MSVTKSLRKKRRRRSIIGIAESVQTKSDPNLGAVQRSHGPESFSAPLKTVLRHDLNPPRRAWPDPTGSSNVRLKASALLNPTEALTLSMLLRRTRVYVSSPKKTARACGCACAISGSVGTGEAARRLTCSTPGLATRGLSCPK